MAEPNQARRRPAQTPSIDAHRHRSSAESDHHNPRAKSLLARSLCRPESASRPLLGGPPPWG